MNYEETRAAISVDPVKKLLADEFMKLWIIGYFEGARKGLRLWPSCTPTQVRELLEPVLKYLPEIKIPDDVLQLMEEPT
jgi:hypothetical protein